MKFLADLAALNRDQRAAFIAAVLGWTLDAFDFFLMVFMLRAIAADFHAKVVEVAFAITLTLMFRPLGALVFGLLAERHGRRPILMINVLLFSFFELASAFAPSLTALLILRALFGFAMGGEWGIGASLVMESIPARSRGTVSGILQEGYPLGYLLASIVYGLLFSAIGWRGMFIVGVIPALLVFYIRMSVKESPIWQQQREHGHLHLSALTRAMLRNWKKFLYLVVLMTAFNFYSHGTQDLYPTFLQAQHKLDQHTVSALLIVQNVGAIIGGIVFGAWSQQISRRRTIVIATACALPIMPLWAFASTPLFLGLGGFLLQFAVQGAWGVIPAHLNELSPGEVRGTFPGFAYQLGNFIASSNAVLQAYLAEKNGGNYALALITVSAVAAVAVGVLASIGREAREVEFKADAPSCKSPSS